MKNDELRSTVQDVYNQTAGSNPEDSLIDYNNIPELSGENVVDVSVDDTTRVGSTATVKRGLNDINGKISTAGDATDSVDVGNANDDAVDVTDNKDKNRNNDENEIGG